MTIGIVQLSDIHFKLPGSNSMLTRATALRAAMRQTISIHDACIIVMSGDTAQAGTTEEYALALTFFKDLLLGISADFAPKPTHFVLIPGNHDCNFKNETGLRQMLLKNAAHAPLPDLSPLEPCLAVQSNYRDFATALQCYQRPGTVPLSRSQWYQGVRGR